MEPILAFVAIALLIIGLVGQAFEMRKIKQSTIRDEDATSENIFLDKRNLKWYAIIVVAILLWYVGGG